MSTPRNTLATFALHTDGRTIDVTVIEQGCYFTVERHGEVIFTGPSEVARFARAQEAMDFAISYAGWS